MYLGHPKYLSIWWSGWSVVGHRQKFMIMNFQIMLYHIVQTLHGIMGLVRNRKKLLYVNMGENTFLYTEYFADMGQESFVVRTWVAGLLTNFKRMMNFLLSVVFVSVKYWSKWMHSFYGLELLDRMPLGIFNFFLEGVYMPSKESSALQLITTGMVDTAQFSLELALPVFSNNVSRKTVYFWHQYYTFMVLIGKYRRVLVVFYKFFRVFYGLWRYLYKDWFNKNYVRFFFFKVYEFYSGYKVFDMLGDLINCYVNNILLSSNFDNYMRYMVLEFSKLCYSRSLLMEVLGLSGYAEFCNVNNFLEKLLGVEVYVGFSEIGAYEGNEMLGFSFMNRCYRKKDFGFLKRLYKKRIFVYSLYGKRVSMSFLKSLWSPYHKKFRNLKYRRRLVRRFRNRKRFKILHLNVYSYVYEYSLKYLETDFFVNKTIFVNKGFVLVVGRHFFLNNNFKQ